MFGLTSVKLSAKSVRSIEQLHIGNGRGLRAMTHRWPLYHSVAQYELTMSCVILYIFITKISVLLCASHLYMMVPNWECKI